MSVLKENGLRHFWSQISAKLNEKVDKIGGKDLSTNDFTNEYKTKLDSIESGAQVNTQADWQQNDETANDYVKNRPGGYDGLTEILPETTLNFNSPQLTLDCPPIEVGKEYTVTFYHPNSNNTEYKLVGRNDSSGLGFTCIGNETYTWGGDTDTTTPFLIYTTSSGNTNIRISSSETLPCTYNIKIKAIAPIKIDEKYLDIKNTNIINGSKIGSLRTVGSSIEGSEYKIGDYAFTEGFNTNASGAISHAEGSLTTASGDYSHTEGYQTNAKGSASHTEGNNTKASGSTSHAEGYGTQALGGGSHAEGNGTLTGQMGFKVTGCSKTTDTTGTYTLTSVYGLSVNQRYSVYLSSSKKNCGKITAINTDTNTITVDGYPDIALSSSSSSTANYLTIVNKPQLGNIEISGSCSHAEGRNTKALGDCSHTEGQATTAQGSYSHAEGTNTTAQGSNSHAEGFGTQALGSGSHAEGLYATASGDFSHAEGWNTTASSNYQHVQGKYNIADTTTYADIIGNGKSDTERSNAATVDWQGNAWYAGDVYTGSTSGTNRDEGSKKLATEEYINTQIGDINTALDSIIEMQNSLIGGN